MLGPGDDGPEHCRTLALVVEDRRAVGVAPPVWLIVAGPWPRTTLSISGAGICWGNECFAGNSTATRER